MAAGLTGALRVAVIGTGRIGAMHAELLAQRVPGAGLVAVADAEPPTARAVASRLGVEVAEPGEILADPNVEAVAICSSTDTHADLVVAAADAGKAVFCEKPVSLDLATVDRVTAATNRAGIPVMVGFNRRFDPAHAAVAAAVENERIGELHLLRITSRDPEPPPLGYFRVSGGIFFDMTVHDFDMARFVVGSEVTEVFARAAARVDPALSSIGEVDTAVITLVHENGCLTAIDNSTRAVYGYDQRVEAFGSAGSAGSENHFEATVVYRSADGSTEPPFRHFFLERYAESYRAEWTAFVEAVRGAGFPAGLPTLADARAALVLGLAAKASLQENRPVSPKEVDRQ